MLLRYLVSQYVRQAAEQKLQEVVQGAAENAADTVRKQSEEPDDDAPVLEPEILFFFATSTESAGLVDQLETRQSLQCATFRQHLGRVGGRVVGVIETGVGAVAEQAIDDALSVHRPAWALAAGFAAALQPEIRRGEILLADEVTNGDGDTTLSVGLQMSSEAVAAVRGLRLGRLASVDRLLTTKAQKQELAGRCHALACDMESLAVARSCQKHHTRFLAVQVITDGLDDQLPPEVDKMLNQESLAGKLGAAAGAIFNRPSSMMDMWDLKEQALRATDRLAKFLISMLPQLT